MASINNGVRVSEEKYPNWFEVSAHPSFEKYLVKYKAKPNLRFLQIGAYKGDASVWMLDNILTDQTSILFDIDTWQGSDESVHRTFDWNDVEYIYDQNILKYNNVIKLKALSRNFLDIPTNMKYDFIYIDGDHTAVGVFYDASMSWKFVKSGGIVAFDDYTWNHESSDTQKAPKIGIDLFLKTIDGQYEMLEKTNQVWIKKI